MNTRTRSEKAVIVLLLLAVAALALVATLSFAREPVRTFVLTAGVTIGEDGMSVDVSTGMINNSYARPSENDK